MRRNPSKIVKANGEYPVWYTTGKDGFVWEEQSVAVPRISKQQVSWRSVSTPAILVWKGKYYLYYQRFMEMSGKRGDD